MASYRGQVVTHYCNTCKTEQEMKPQRDGFEGRIVWLKCTGCSALLFLKKEEYEALLGNTGKKFDDAEQEYVSYNPNDTYSVGQLLYHPVWDDRGEVLKKEVTSSGHHSIIVAFHRLGQRTLIENLSA